MTASECATARPFTIALCVRCSAEPNVAVLQYLRRSIRRCAHGVLVTTGCLRGSLSCTARPHGPGAVVVLQPCSVDRVPVEPARWIGPISDPDDLYVVCDWLEGGEWDMHMLPERLHVRSFQKAVSRRN